MNITGTIKRSEKLTGTINSMMQTLSGNICKAGRTTDRSDHVITTANAAGDVIETVPEVVTYTIEEET